MMDLLASLVQSHKYKPPSTPENMLDLPLKQVSSGQTIENLFSTPPADRHIADDDNGYENTYDIDAYLAANKVTLDAPRNTASTPQPQPKRMPTMGNPEPVQLGAPKSSHHMELLQHICNEKRIVPVFEFEEDPHILSRFTGTLTIGREKIILGRMEASKRNVKLALAEMAIPLVKEMPSAVQKPEGNLVTENWIGKLVEFCAATCNSTSIPPTYTDFALGQAFACECQIAQSPTPFGSRTTPFATKKLAKSSAAKAAVQYLIQSGYLLPDGSVPPRPKKIVAPQPKLRKPGGLPMLVTEKSDEDKSWPRRAMDLAMELGLGTPEYRFQSADPVNAPNIYDGAAYFTGSVFLEGPVGEVRGVFGKKKAREACAEEVWGVLEDLRKVRLGEK